MAKLSIKLQLLHTAYAPNKLKALALPSVLFLGRSNVGKSSLINAISHSSLAQVSKTPGKTRSINYYQYGSKLTLVDLPGYGYAKRSQEEREDWRHLMYAFFETLAPGHWANILMDAKRDLEVIEDDLVMALLEKKAHIKILLTKSDRLNQSLRKQRENYISRHLKNKFDGYKIDWQFVSAKTLEGIDTIKKELYQYGQGNFI